VWFSYRIVDVKLRKQPLFGKCVWYMHVCVHARVCVHACVCVIIYMFITHVYIPAICMYAYNM